MDYISVQGGKQHFKGAFARVYGYPGYFLWAYRTYPSVRHRYRVRIPNLTGVFGRVLGS